MMIKLLHNLNAPSLHHPKINHTIAINKFLQLDTFD